MPRPHYVLGLSAYYHDSAAALLCDGEIVAAAQEERFSRKKGDAAFPAESVRACLAAAGISSEDLARVAFYDKPILKFGRILETAIASAPRGLRSFLMALPQWLKRKLWVPQEIVGALPGDYELLFAEHHQAHAASAFYPSPFEEAAVLTVDGAGEWATTTIGHGGRGEARTLRLLEELRFPHSLGLLYSAFTYHCGFKVNSGEYKLMGLAPYGEPRFTKAILEEVVERAADGSFRLNLEFFDYVSGLHMTSARFDARFEGPPRKPESRITRREMDLAASIQQATETILFGLVERAVELTGCTDLCLAGGVALNCVANGKIVARTKARRVWIQPAAGDAGGALGAAYAAHHLHDERPRVVARVRSSAGANEEARDAMKGALLGPAFSDAAVCAFLDARGAPYRVLDDDALFDAVAALLDEGKVVGWFQGRMEFGPRALGNRSILGDARRADTQRVMNLKIKYRESFRPFAPVVLAEHAGEVFAFEGESPYMLLTADVLPARRLAVTPRGGAEQDADDLLAKVNEVRSDLPAITHVDGSARLQTVDAERNPRFHALLSAFHRRTGCPVLVNTSFNVRGEPIVCTPAEAYTCFMRTELDHLVLGNVVLAKPDQPPLVEQGDWRAQFTLD